MLKKYFVAKYAVAAAIILFGVVMANSALADTVYSTLGPGGSYFFQNAVSGSNPVSGPLGGLAMPFTVGSGTNFNLTQIDIALTFWTGTNGATVELLGDSSGLPGGQVLGAWSLSNLPVLGVSTTNTIQPSQTISGIAGITLDGGATYWLAVFAPSGSTDVWNFAFNGPIAGNFVLSSDGGSTWVLKPQPSSLSAFDVLGTAVPEPSSLLLLGLGLISVVGLGCHGKRLAYTRGTGVARTAAPYRAAPTQFLLEHVMRRVV